jgi:hypothetical protein
LINSKAFLEVKDFNLSCFKISSKIIQKLSDSLYSRNLEKLDLQGIEETESIFESK